MRTVEDKLKLASGKSESATLNTQGGDLEGNLDKSGQE